MPALMRPRLGIETIDVEQRARVLEEIAESRVKLAEISNAFTALPTWMKQPLGADQAAFEAAFKNVTQAEPGVAALERRLTAEKGPVWQGLNPQEQTALANWTKNVDMMGDLFYKHFPTETQKDVARIGLLLTAVAALVAPLVLTAPAAPGKRRFLPPGLPFTKKEPVEARRFMPTTVTRRPFFGPPARPGAAPGAQPDVGPRFARPFTSMRPPTGASPYPRFQRA